MDFSVLDTGKSKIKALASESPGEGAFPGVRTASFSLCLHVAERELGSHVWS